MRQILRSVSAFAIGASVGFVLELYFPPEEMVHAAWVVIPLSGAVFIASYWPEMRQWWWLRRTSFMRIANPLRITHVLDLHEFLADEGRNGIRYRLVADPNDRARPPVNEGDWVIVKGKLRERMRGGYNTLVQCRIRVRQ